MSDLKVGSLSPVGATAAGAAHARAKSVVSANAASPSAGSPVGAANATNAQAARTASAPAAPMVQTAALDAGQAPVDTDRVETIRNAIASGHYPLIPARIGDAMIAAGILLRSGEA